MGALWAPVKYHYFRRFFHLFDEKEAGLPGPTCGIVRPPFARPIRFEGPNVCTSPKIACNLQTNFESHGEYRQNTAVGPQAGLTNKCFMKHKNGVNFAVGKQLYSTK